MITTGITAPGSYATPEAAVDPAGNIIVVWNSGAVIQATRSTPNGGWQLPPATLSTAGARDPHVAVDGAGNAIAVWVGPGGIDDQFEVVHTARYSAASDTWSSARTLSAVGIDDPHVAMDPAGNATVVWGKTVGTITAPIAVVEAVRYTAATNTWGFIQGLTATSATAVDSVRVVADGAGNATAVWQRINGGTGQIAAARFSVPPAPGPSTCCCRRQGRTPVFPKSPSTPRATSPRCGCGRTSASRRRDSRVPPARGAVRPS